MGQIITPMIQKPEKSEDNKQISLMMNDTNGVRHDHHWNTCCLLSACIPTFHNWWISKYSPKQDSRVVTNYLCCATAIFPSATQNISLTISFLTLCSDHFVFHTLWHSRPQHSISYLCHYGNPRLDEIHSDSQFQHWHQYSIRNDYNNYNSRAWGDVEYTSRSTLSWASESSTSQCLNAPGDAISARNDIAGALKHNSPAVTNLLKRRQHSATTE